MFKNLSFSNLLSAFLLLMIPFTSFAQEVVPFEKYTVGYLNERDSLVQLSEKQLKQFWAQYAQINVESLNQPIVIEIKWSEAQMQNLYLVKTTSYDNTQVGTLLRAIERGGKTVLVYQTTMDKVLGVCKTDGTCKLTFDDNGVYECVLPNGSDDATTCKKTVLGFGVNIAIQWNLYFPKQ